MRLLQVTLGAAATPITTDKNLYASFLIIQNNAAAAVRVGDNTVSASKGILLSGGTAPGGSATNQFPFPRGTHLSDWYLFGTSTQIIDILYEPSA
jgi:hypothetical protein